MSHFLCGMVSISAGFLLADAGAAGESGPELIKQAIANRGDVAIRSGEFRYRLEVAEGTPSSQMIDARVEQVRNALREQLRLHSDNPAMSKQIQKAIDTAQDYVPPQVIKNANLSYRYYFALQGPELGGDRYVEFASLDRETGASGDSSVLLTRSYGAGRGSSVEFNPLAGTVVVAGGRRDVYQPSQEPQRLGRAVGVLPHLVPTTDPAELGERLSAILEDVEVGRPEDAEFPDVSEIKFRVDAPELGGEEVSMVYRVAAAHGFVTPLIREYRSGTLVREWISSDYAEVTPAGLWYPRSCEFRDHAAPGGQPHVERYRFEPDGVKLNHEVPADRFRVAVAPETPVVDATAGNANFVAARAVSLSIDDAASLAAVDGLIVAPRPNPPGGEPTAATSPGRAFIAVNVAAALVIVVLLLVRRRREARGSLLLLASLQLLPGCGASASGTVGEPDRPPFRLEPELVDLGEVDVDRGLIAFAFRVENVSEEDVVVRIDPGCGCTVVDEQVVTLPAGATHTADVKLSLRGRVGNFRNLVRVSTESNDAPGAEWSVDLPVQAVVFDHWRASPRRVVIEKGGSGTVSVTAPASAWEGIRTGPIGRGIDLDQTVVDRWGASETRSYRVTSLPGPASGGDAGIGFSRDGDESPFFTVPVVVR